MQTNKQTHSNFIFILLQYTTKTNKQIINIIYFLRLPKNKLPTIKLVRMYYFRK